MFTEPTTTYDQASPTFEEMTAPAASMVSKVASVASEATVQSVGVPMALISWTSDSSANSSCVRQANEHETQLKNLTLVNILILVVLFIVFIANAREGKSISLEFTFGDFLTM